MRLEKKTAHFILGNIKSHWIIFTFFYKPTQCLILAKHL